MDAKPLNVLSFDGGGMRGLLSLLILRSLMLRLKIRSKCRTDPRPCEIFDFICGTSTGGLIALMLGRLRMSVDEAISCYTHLSKAVFEEKSAPSPSPSFRDCWQIVRWVMWPIYEVGGFGGQEREDRIMFDASILEKCLKEMVATYGGDVNSPLEDSFGGEKEICRTFVVAVTKSYGDFDSYTKIFRSYSTSREHADTCGIWQSARATTAIHPFFSPISVGDPPVTFLAETLSEANNPSRLVIDEVQEVFPGRSIACLLSLGNGIADVVSVTGNQVNIGEACNQLATSCELVDHALGQDFFQESRDLHLERYFRFSVSRVCGNIAFDECTHLQELAAVTEGYMRGYIEQARSKECVDVLIPRALEVGAQPK